MRILCLLLPVTPGTGLLRSHLVSLEEESVRDQHKSEEEKLIERAGEGAEGLVEGLPLEFLMVKVFKAGVRR